MNDNQEIQDVDGPRPGDNFAEIKINMEAANKQALKDVISKLVDQAYAQDEAVQRKFSKPHIQPATKPVVHQIMPAIAAGRVGSMIANLPPVILKEKSKK